MTTTFDESTNLWTLEIGPVKPDLSLTVKLTLDVARQLWSDLDVYFANEPIPLIPPKSVTYLPVPRVTCDSRVIPPASKW